MIGGQPVLWVNVKSLVGSGPYAETNMEQWNQALLRRLRHVPEHARLRLGRGGQGLLVHPGRHPLHLRGLRARAQLIAKALAKAFPADGSESPTCVVHA